MSDQSGSKRCIELPPNTRHLDQRLSRCVQSRRRVVSGLAGMVALASPAAIHAQASSAAPFPERGRPLRLIVPWGAGGVVDVIGRALASAWDADWGSSTVVINKPGANGQLGLNELVASRPDGLTIALTHNWDTQISYLDPSAKATYHRGDFVPVALVQQTGPVVMVRADSPFKSLRDLVAAARSRPDQITYATSGPRSETTRIMRLFTQKHGARFNLIPFKDVPSSITALIGGHLDVAGSNVAVARPHVRSGVLRVLSAHEVTGQPGLRNPFFPDVPTSREEGFDIDLIASTGMALPRGTAEPIVLAWSAAIRRALETDGVRSALHSAGVATQWLSPQDYAAHWRDAERKVKAFLEDSGVAVREG